MTTFDIITPDMGTPWFVTLLVMAGFLLLTGLCIVAAVKFHYNVKRDGAGSTLFVLLAALTIFVAFLSPVFIGSIDRGIRDTLLVAELEDRGYDNIDLNLRNNTFTGSDEDGLFVRGDILEKSYTEYVVVIRND